MIIDARQIDCGAGIEANLCIVGAGAAGVTKFLQPCFPAYVTESKAAQAPHHDSRIIPQRARDPLGANRVVLDWRTPPIDRHTVVRAEEIVAGELRLKIGTLEQWSAMETTEWPASRLEGAWHQPGTTRVHADPRRGVVDRDCRVHGLSNLFTAGGSVVPSVGSAQPALTIVALSLRLSEHLMSLVARTDAVRVVPSHDRAALLKPSPVHRCSRGAPLQLRPAGAGATWTTGRRPIDLRASTPAGQGAPAVLTKPPEQ